MKRGENAHKPRPTFFQHYAVTKYIRSEHSEEEKRKTRMSDIERESKK